MEKNEQRDRKFETLFDGDEVDGKFYGLGHGITNLDAPTSTYLVNAGRIAEVDDERFSQLDNIKGEAEGPNSQAADTGEGGESDEDKAAREAAEERYKAAADEYTAGNVPTDLVNANAPADAKDRLIEKNDLLAIAEREGATFKPAQSKAQLAVAIMARRAEVAEADTAE